MICLKKNSILTFFGVIILLIVCCHLCYTCEEQFFSSAGNFPQSKVKEDRQKIRLAATGDIMLHSPQVTSGQQRDGSYDFSSFFKEIKPYVSAADLSIANLEVSLGGRPPYSGYPRFNSPDEIIDAVRDAGFSIVSTANNHAMDMGVSGVKRTYQVVNQKGIMTVGTASSAEDRKATLVTKKGIKLAFLAYTESTNGLPVPEPYLINKINLGQIDLDIKEAKNKGADFIIVSLHFGTEYQRVPNGYQRQTAQHVFESGADVILGSHPHVIQPMKKLKVNGKDKFIIYSMGNFVSNQTDLYTDEGIIVYIDIEKQNGKTTLKHVSYLPTFCHRYRKNGKSQYVVIPVEKQLPTQLPRYPGLTQRKWTEAYNHTYHQITSNELFSVFHME